MKTDEGWRRLQRVVGHRLGDLHIDVPKVRRADKGYAGKLLEEIIGLRNGTQVNDFEDGELKSFKPRKDGSPQDPMFVAELTDVDEILMDSPFVASRVHAKTKRMILVGIRQDEVSPRDWYIESIARLNAPPGSVLFSRLKTSYVTATQEWSASVRAGFDGRFIAKGEWMHIRQHDSPPYKELWSNQLARVVSTRRLAFYLERAMFSDLVTSGDAIICRPR